MDRVGPASREVQRSQLWIDLAEVGHRRHDSGLQHLHRERVLDGHAHGMTGVALRVRDDDGVGVRAEDPTQRVDLRAGAATSGGGVRLVRDEDGLRGDLVAGDLPLPFRVGDQLLHDTDNVIYVEPTTVEGAVGHDGTQHLADRPDAPFRGGLQVLDHQRRSAHADDEAVPALIER